MVTWKCLAKDCPAGESGTNWAQMDREAAEHTKDTQHGTTVETRGAKRTRPGGGG